jgi:hypothetical protein
MMTAVGTSMFATQSWDEKRITARAACMIVAGSPPDISRRTRSRRLASGIPSTVRSIIRCRKKSGRSRAAFTIPGKTALTTPLASGRMKCRAVAHSTRPRTRSGCRLQHSLAIGPPIE